MIDPSGLRPTGGLIPRLPLPKSIPIGADEVSDIVGDGSPGRGVGVVGAGVVGAGVVGAGVVGAGVLNAALVGLLASQAAISLSYCSFSFL
tara:strand:- start:48 stop:320 length:273 start_codon:yes stop_codon:yes gene_type:complete